MSEEQDLLQSIHRAFFSFRLRAEKVSDEGVKETFVDSAPLIDILSTGNSQVFYGRRGTGKTHALKVVADRVAEKKEAVVYLDLRSVGSDSSIYSDPDRPLPERATLLLNDVLLAALAELYNIAGAALDKAQHPDQILLRLDDFQAAINSVRVRGTVETETRSQSKNANRTSMEATATLATSSTLSAKGTAEVAASREEERVSKHQGTESLHLDFGTVQSALTGLVEVLGVTNLWLLIDEWSEVPIALQPFLADLIRRTILPARNCVVLIAAIEHRSNFMIRRERGEYVGVELGADLPVSLNLDDFLVFDSSEDKSVAFFKNLLFRHYRASESADERIHSPDELIRTAFTQQNVFGEFVRAIEGVPRDALSLLASIATKNFGSRISMQHVRTAVLEWFQREKAAVLRNNEELSRVLDLIIDVVIGSRNARAFLFPSNVSDSTIDQLFDARVLHILKRNVSAKDAPGERYDVFKVDYGFYVDKINTAAEPAGLLEDDDGFSEVPKDDYRSIRRAVLTPDMLKPNQAPTQGDLL